MADLNKNISQSNDMPDYEQEQLVQAIEEKTEEAIQQIEQASEKAENQLNTTLQSEQKDREAQIKKQNREITVRAIKHTLRVFNLTNSNITPSGTKMTHYVPDFPAKTRSVDRYEDASAVLKDFDAELEGILGKGNSTEIRRLLSSQENITPEDRDKLISSAAKVIKNLYKKPKEQQIKKYGDLYAELPELMKQSVMAQVGDPFFISNKALPWGIILKQLEDTKKDFSESELQDMIQGEIQDALKLISALPQQLKSNQGLAVLVDNLASAAEIAYESPTVDNYTALYKAAGRLKGIIAGLPQELEAILTDESLDIQSESDVYNYLSKKTLGKLENSGNPLELSSAVSRLTSYKETVISRQQERENQRIAEQKAEIEQFNFQLPDEFNFMSDSQEDDPFEVMSGQDIQDESKSVKTSPKKIDYAAKIFNDFIKPDKYRKLLQARGYDTTQYTEEKLASRSEDELKQLYNELKIVVQESISTPEAQRPNLPLAENPVYQESDQLTESLRTLNQANALIGRKSYSREDFSPDIKEASAQIENLQKEAAIILKNIQDKETQEESKRAKESSMQLAAERARKISGVFSRYRPDTEKLAEINDRDFELLLGDLTDIANAFEDQNQRLQRIGKSTDNFSGTNSKNFLNPFYTYTSLSEIKAGVKSSNQEISNLEREADRDNSRKLREAAKEVKQDLSTRNSLLQKLGRPVPTDEIPDTIEGLKEFQATIQEDIKNLQSEFESLNKRNSRKQLKQSLAEKRVASLKAINPVKYKNLTVREDVSDMNIQDFMQYYSELTEKLNQEQQLLQDLRAKIAFLYTIETQDSNNLHKEDIYLKHTEDALKGNVSTIQEAQHVLDDYRSLSNSKSKKRKKIEKESNDRIRADAQKVIDQIKATGFTKYKNLSIDPERLQANYWRQYMFELRQTYDEAQEAYKNVQDNLLKEVERFKQGGYSTDELSQELKLLLDSGINNLDVYSAPVLEQFSKTLKSSADKQDKDALRSKAVELIQKINQANSDKNLKFNATAFNRDPGVYIEDLRNIYQGLGALVTSVQPEDSAISDELDYQKISDRIEKIIEDIKQTASGIKNENDRINFELEVFTSLGYAQDALLNGESISRVNDLLDVTQSKIDQIAGRSSKIEETVENTPSALQRIQSILDGISNAIEKTFSVLNRVSNISRSLFGFLGNTWKTFKTGITYVTNFSKAIFRSRDATGALSRTWTELNSKLSVFQRAYDAIFNNKYITSAQDMMGSIVGINQLSKEAASEIITVAEKMEAHWGEAASSIVDSTSQLAILLKSLGMQTEYVGNASLMLTTIGLDLADRGLMGGDYDAVMDKILSAMRGMTASANDIGIDIRASALDDLLKRIKKAPQDFGLTAESVANLASSTDGLTESQLVYLRIFRIYEQQMQNYGAILGNVNSFIDTSVGRMSALRNAATSLFSTIGRAVYEIAASVAPYIEYIIRLITAMINKFTAWLGQFSLFANISSSLSQANENLGNAFNDATQSVEDNTEATQENNEATTQGSLASFDRIESLDSQSSAMESQADLSGLMNALPNIQDLIDSAIEGESRVEQLGDKFKEAANDLRSAVEDWLSKTTGRKIDITFGMDFAKVSALLSFIGKKLYDTLKNVFRALAAYLAAVFDDIQIGKFLQNILTIIAILLNAINSFSQGLLGSVFGAVAPEGLKSFTQSLDDFITKNEYDQIFKQEAILDEQGNPVLDAEGNPLTRTVIDESKIPTFDQFFEDLAESYPKLATFFTNLATFFRQLADTAGALANALAPLIPQLITFASETLLPKLTEYLQIAGDWISNNTDKIQDFLTRLGEWGWETLQTVIEGIGKAIAYIIENPDTLFSVLDGISNVVGTVLSNPALSTFLGGLILFQDPLDALGESSELAFDGISTLLTGIQMLSNIKLGGLFGAGATGAGAAGAAGTGAAGAATAIPVIGIVVAAILSIITALTSNEELFNRLKDAFGRLFEAVGNLNEAMSPITDVLWKIIETVGTVLVNILIILADAIANIINFFSSLGDIFIGFITFDKDRIAKGIEGLFNSISDFFTQGFQDIVKLFSDLIDNIIGIFKKKDQEVDLENYDYDTNMMLIDSRADGDDWSDEYKQQVIDEYHQKFGNDKVDSDEFMKWLTVEHATGGIFNQAHFAQVAEDGPEAIIPLSSKYRSRALAIYGAAGHMLFGSSAMDITSQINSMTAIKSVPSIGSLNSNPAVSGVPPISEDDLFETIVNAIEAGGSGLINKLLSLGLLGSRGTGTPQVPESQLLMQLAKLLAPYFVANASNIANTSFSM